MKQKLYLFILIVFCHLISYGQILDQNNNAPNAASTSLSNSGNLFLAQSFTNGMTGNLTRISVNIPNYSVTVGGDFDLTIYQGEGIGGTVLRTKTFTVANNDVGDVIINFAAVPVISGQKNTLKISPSVGSSASFQLSLSDNVYTGGNLYIGSFGLSTDYDLKFKTYFPSPGPATHLNFDGVDDYVTLPNPSSFHFNSNMTVEFWMNSNVTPQQGDAMVSKGASWGLTLNSTGTASFYGAGGFNAINSTTVITDGVWHHVAGTWDGTTANLYIDGTLENSTSVYVNGTISNTPTAASIGQNLFNTGTFYQGNIDEVRVWNFAKSISQIQDSRYCELAGNDTGLVAYYKFNQGIDAQENMDESTLFDDTTNANNGILSGFAKNGTTSNFLAGSIVTSVITPIVTTPVSFFVGDATNSSTLLQSVTGDDLLWYTVATGGTGSLTAPTASTANAGSTSYWVSSKNANGCETARVELVVTVNAIDNNICAGATPLTVGVVFADNPVSINMTGATNSGVTLSNCADGVLVADRWLSVVVPASGRLTIETNKVNVEANNVDTVFAAYSGTCSNLTEIDCDDDGSLNPGNFSKLSFTGLTPGTTIYIRAWEYGELSSTNSFKVSAYDAPIIPNFTQVSASCATSTLSPLPTTSINDVVGTWSPALNNTSTTTYTFTPADGQFASSTTMTIIINSPPSLTYAAVQTNYPVGAAITPLIPTNTGGLPNFYDTPVVTIIADEEQGISFPSGIVTDNLGNVIFADTNNNAIKKIAPNGTITTIGSGFSEPKGVAIDAAGNIYVADAGNGVVKKIATDNTIEDIGTFDYPVSVAIDGLGNVFVGSYGDNDEIYKRNAGNSSFTLFASGTNFGLNPLAVDSVGNIYIAKNNDFQNDIVKITPNGTITTVAVELDEIYGIMVDSGGNIFYTERFENKVKKLSVSGVTTIISTMTSPYGITQDKDGNIFVTTCNAKEVKKIVSKFYSIDPTLPTGMSFNLSSGVISGIPTVGTASTLYTISSSNSCGFNDATVTFATCATLPTFTQVAAICPGGTLSALPTTSINDIVGTWSPALNNMATTTYTFLPSGGVCAGATTMTIEVLSVKTWKGSPAAWTPCAPSNTDDAVIAADYSEATNLTLNSLTVNNNAVASIPSGYDLVLTDILTVATGSSLTLENNANLMQTTTSANVGNIIVKRNTSIQRLAYTNWSSPVAAQNALAFSPQTIADRFYTYNEVTNAFVALPTPSTTDFIPTAGYSVRAPNTFADAPSAATQFVGTFTGIPNNGSYSFNATKTGVNGGYNLIGNPYPSTLLASAFFAGNPDVTTLYFWNNTVLGGSGGANYATKTTMTSVRATSDPKLPTDFIASGQGFFAEVSTTATLNFENSMRSSDNTSAVFFRNGNVDKHLFKINLLSPNNTFNQIAIGYVNGATSGVDNQIDAVPFADSATMISSLINNKNYVIQGRGLPFTTSDIVPMGFKTNVAGTYSMTSEAFEGVFAENQNIFLKDNLAGITHNIKESPYSFTTNTGTFNNRFEIVYTNSVLGIENPSFNENSVFVFKKDNTINVNSGTSQMKNVQIYDLRGRLVAEKLDVNATTSIINVNVEQQVLLVKITTIDNQQITKKIVY